MMKIYPYFVSRLTKIVHNWYFRSLDVQDYKNFVVSVIQESKIYKHFQGKKFDTY